MAALAKSGQIDADNTFKPFPGGTMGVRYASFSWSSAPAADTVIQMTDLFRGETVMDVVVKCSVQMASSMVIDVGFGSTVSGTTATTNSYSNALINNADAGASAGGVTKTDANFAPVVMNDTTLGGAEWANVGKTPGPTATTLDLYLPAVGADSGVATTASSGTLEVWVTVA